MISSEIGYIEDEEFNIISLKCKKIGSMLGKLIKARSGKNE